MEQNGRNKTKYTSPHTTTWPTKQTTDARVSPETYWKYIRRNNQDTTDKNIRRYQNPMPEPTVSYYTSANSYKTLKHNSYPYSTHLKHSSALHTEAPQRYQQTTKSGRNKDCNNNIAVINKDRYKTQQQDENNAEYIDEELGNFTEDNLEQEAEEEAENDQERANESLDKEYDEQEADDEIDEESDAEPHAMQRNVTKKDTLLRAQQRMRLINQQQEDPHRIHYSQYSPKLYQAHPLSTRYYHNIPDRDIHEALSEEDLYATQALKNPPRRSSVGYHQNWIPQRSSADRYDTIASLTHPSRRPRTRPEIKSFTEAEFAERRKCSRCGNVSARKPSILRRNNYRFQDNSNFSKGHFGDDAEILDQFWCGHCKPKYHLEESIGHCKSPSPTLYSMKLRRSKDINIPMHETLEGKHAMDEISHEFARMPSRYTKDTSNIIRDRTRHSVQTAQGANRMSVRYNS